MSTGNKRTTTAADEKAAVGRTATDPAPRLPPAPPLLLAAALLVWGWQTGFLLFAIAMALTLEAPRFIAWRWPIDDREFNNIADLSGVGFFIIVIYIFASEASKGIFTILALLPFILFLLLLAQQFSEKQSIRLSALFMSMRRLDPGKSPDALARIDLALPYVLVTLLAASAGNQRTPWFFVCATALVLYMLWQTRSPRYSARIWLLAATIAIGTGYAGQVGIQMLQRALETSIMQVFDQFVWRYRDPNRATTAIGSLGRVKLSNRIVARVNAESPLAETLLLREASYDTYGYSVWSSQRRDFHNIEPELSGRDWVLFDGDRDRRLQVSTYMTRDIGVIPVPHNTSRIVNVAAADLHQNSLGTVRMEIRKGWIHYGVDYGEESQFDSPPGSEDLYVSDVYRADFTRLADELHLRGQSDPEIVTAIRDYFAKDFTYSLTQRQRFPRGRYLAKFLFESKSGHCEFFATATTLLLRAAGIPARYVVGYAVDEYSALEGQYVVRARHAHSWSQAYVDGRWQILDTTPAVWAPLEAQAATPMQPLFDLWSWISYKFSRWQRADELEEETGNTYLLWLLLPLATILAWRLFLKERIQRRRGVAPAVRTGTAPGMDSALFGLLQTLEKLGFQKLPGETAAAWLQRIKTDLDVDAVLAALTIHYRYRFDPGGISVSDKERLSDLCTRLQTQLRKSVVFD